MSRHSEKNEDLNALREKIIGLGEGSIRKTYYPKLQRQFQKLERFRALLDQSNDAIFLINVSSGAFIDVNETACRRLSYSREQLLALSFYDVADTSTLNGVDGLFDWGQPGMQDRPTHEISLIRSNGQKIPVELGVRIVSFGGCDYAVAAARDITERKLAEELVRETLRRQEAILNSIPDIAWLKDRAGRYVAVNEAYQSLSGLESSEIIGKTDVDIWPAKSAERFMHDDREVMRSGERLIIEEQVKDNKGNLRWYETIKIPIYNEAEQVTGTTGIARDITQRKRMEETITYQAHHDLLTGLPNKMLFMDHLGLELSRARRSRSIIAVLFLDLDRFKNINDALGHTAGDLLLKEVAGRLSSSLRKADTIGRIGGDEFTILLTHITHTEDAARIAEKFRTSFEDPFKINGQQLRITASIGISIYPDDGEYAETLLKNADIAMYQAKDLGRNNFQFYNPAANVKGRLKE